MSRMIEGKVMINSFADLFDGDPSEIIEVPLKDLHSFKDHPFKVVEDEKMAEMVESIKEHGVLEPGVVRYKTKVGYEIIAGHRRKRACELAGLLAMPVIVRNYEDDEAILAMIASNMQREEILPSEKAFAYKMKLEVLKRRAGRPSKGNSCQVGTNFRADEALAENSTDSARNIQRYIRLTELITPILDMVDAKKIKFIPAFELSYLTAEQQEILLRVMDEESVVPSLSQAQQLKKLNIDGKYSKESVHAIMVVAPVRERKFTIKNDILSKYFSPDTSVEDIEKTICALLDEWQRNGGRK